MYTLGPEHGRLSVRTGKTGAAAKAGHNLLIEVGAWRATLDPDAGTLSLSADARSLRVVEGTGGLQALGEDDRDAIGKTIDSEVLKGTEIAYESSAVTAEGDALRIDGSLELSGRRRPLSLTLTLAGGRVSGSARFNQSDWGMKPYSALFGTLKVADEIEVAIDATLP